MVQLTHPVPARSFTEIWPYIVVAASGVVLLFMMFQPWVTASNWNGSASVNAFGRIVHSTRNMTIWTQSAPASARIDGVWAILATIAILVEVMAAIQAVLRRNELSGSVAAIAAIVVTLLVLIDVLNLDRSTPEIVASLGKGNDLGSQLALVVGAVRGTSAYPWPGKEVPLKTSGLTLWALASMLVAAGSAVGVLMRSWRGGLRAIVAVATRLV